MRVKPRVTVELDQGGVEEVSYSDPVATRTPRLQLRLEYDVGDTAWAVTLLERAVEDLKQDLKE